MGDFWDDTDWGRQKYWEETFPMSLCSS